jgi:hypothetical protein
MVRVLKCRIGQPPRVQGRYPAAVLNSSSLTLHRKGICLHILVKKKKGNGAGLGQEHEGKRGGGGRETSRAGRKIGISLLVTVICFLLP